MVYDEFLPLHSGDGLEIRKPSTISSHFLNAFRPPSRHKTPPKAIGLEVPPSPRTPPETQDELEEVKGLSKTVNLKGLSELRAEIASRGNNIIDDQEKIGEEIDFHYNNEEENKKDEGIIFYNCRTMGENFGDDEATTKGETVGQTSTASGDERTSETPILYQYFLLFYMLVDQ